MSILIFKPEKEELFLRSEASTVRNKIYSELGNYNTIVINLINVKNISGCYADELFGVMFLDLGCFWEHDSVRVINASEWVLKSISEAIIERGGKP